MHNNSQAEGEKSDNLTIESIKKDQYLTYSSTSRPRSEI